jgi:hypothetical protein
MIEIVQGEISHGGSKENYSPADISVVGSSSVPMEYRYFRLRDVERICASWSGLGVDRTQQAVAALVMSIQEPKFKVLAK